MSGVIDNLNAVYNVVQCDSQFEVRTTSGRVILVCSDKLSAQHYNDLLSEAYKSGYKQGYKEGRKV